MEQFLGDTDPTVGDALDDVAGESVTVDGIVWTVYDRTGMEDPGNRSLIYEIALPSGGSLIVSGTADASDIELVASRSFTSLKG